MIKYKKNESTIIGINHHKTRFLLSFIFVIILIISNLALALAQPVPSKPQENSIVFDYARLVSGPEAKEIRDIAGIIEDKTKAQIVVVTMDNLSGRTIEDYALDLFRKWGIGDKEKNNGILILVNRENLVKDQAGRIRIEVGYGLEGVINDGKAGALGVAEVVAVVLAGKTKLLLL